MMPGKKKTLENGYAAEDENITLQYGLIVPLQGFPSTVCFVLV